MLPAQLPGLDQDCDLALGSKLYHGLAKSEGWQPGSSWESEVGNTDGAR